MRSCIFARRRGTPGTIESRGVRDGVAWLAALLLAVLPFGARAADDDLPGRVGRIAEFAGQLFQSAQDRPTEWDAIGINYPITSGDNLWVSDDGRAEVDYGGGQFRLAGDTSVHVSRLDDRQLALFIPQGRLIVRVRALDPGDVARIDTPNTQVTLTRPGLYRVDVVPDQEATTLTVREGEAIVALANGAQQSLPGQTVSVVGANPAAADIRNSFGVDGFDTWSADRDRRYEYGRSTVYVSREMVGYADLDEHGTWQTYPDYGAVWFPNAVASDWAPYRDGYWTDVGGWGPTWVDRAPWGYAPSHYGRWARIGGRWGWAPGGFVARPVWAPALVAWVGGPDWGVSVGRGTPVYGWVPLGWGDAYHPSWRRCSYHCWARYNRPYAVDVTVRPKLPPARYANVTVPGALSAVDAPALVGRRPVVTNLVSLPTSLMASAPVMTSPPPVARGPRPAPDGGAASRNPPAGASTHVRAPRPEPAGSGVSSRPPVARSPGPGAAPIAPSGGVGQGGTWSVPMPTARPGSAMPADGVGTSRPPVDASFAPRPAPRTIPVPSQSAEAAQTRREPARSRDVAVPPVASPAVPAGVRLSTPNALSPVPGLPAPGRAARSASPDLPAGGGVPAPAATPVARPAPPANVSPAPPANGSPATPANVSPAQAAPDGVKGRTSAEKPVPEAQPGPTGRVR